MSEVRLPRASDRIAIVGRTGSGKTVAAGFHLWKQDIDRRPFFILDYKGDDLINGIEKAVHIDFDADPRKIKQPGIYVLRLMPGEDAACDSFLWKVWERENCGLWTDEGYMIKANSKPFNSIMTQGRSKKITAITLSQRPVWMSRFVFSEASFFQVYDLTHDEDVSKCREFIKDRERKMIGPNGLPVELPDYHSWYYDVARKQLNHFAPVPDTQTILDGIDAKLPRRQRTL